MCIKDIICLTLPIGWNQLGAIATSLGAIATFCTVLVALCANRKATTQLNSALAMQEQSKNVGLYKERIELMQAIQSSGDVFEPSLKILFNDEICSHYKVWKSHLSEKASAEQDLDMFFWLSSIPDGEGGRRNHIKDTIQEYEVAMKKSNCPQQIFDEYKAFCDDHVILGKGEKPTAYNHAEIKDRIARATSHVKKEQEVTLQLIEKFIADSIREIDGKKWRKKGRSRPERRR